MAIEHFNLETWISRISPSFLFSEASDTLLNPTVRSLGVLLQEQTSGLVEQSDIGGPELAASVAAYRGYDICGGGVLAVSYTKFMREE